MRHHSRLVLGSKTYGALEVRVGHAMDSKSSHSYNNHKLLDYKFVDGKRLKETEHCLVGNADWYLF